MKALLFILLIGFATTVFGFEATLTFSSTPADAKIYLNGEMKGIGKATIALSRAVMVEVRIEREGYITYRKNYIYHKGSVYAHNENKGGYDRGDNYFTATLENDPAFENAKKGLKELEDGSFKTDSANTFIIVGVDSKYNIQESWKLVTKVANDYFDDFEENKGESGNLKSTWQAKVVGSKKIRSRLIVKVNTDSPLTYKVKIQSEYSDDSSVSTKDDEKFKEWDRVLKKYRGLLMNFNSKLTSK
jgi:hypothetical protein